MNVAQTPLPTQMQAVLAYTNGEGGLRKIGERFGVAHTTVKGWYLAAVERGDVQPMPERKSKGARSAPARAPSPAPAGEMPPPPTFTAHDPADAPTLSITLRVCANIAVGTVADVAARAEGVSGKLHAQWLEQGREDADAGEDTPHAQYRALTDQAACQYVVFANRVTVAAAAKGQWRAVQAQARYAHPDKGMSDKYKPPAENKTDGGAALAVDMLKQVQARKGAA